MDDNLYAQLRISDGKTVYQTWRRIFSDSPDEGIESVLQILIDMTGYDYKLVSDDVNLLKQNKPNVVVKRITETPCEPRGFLKDNEHCTHVIEFLQELIVRPYNEILVDNECFNLMLKLTTFFGHGSRDEFVEVGAYIGSVMLEHLYTVHRMVVEEIQRATLIRANERLALLEQKQDYVHRVCGLLFQCSRVGLQFKELCVPLTVRFCRLLETFADQTIIENDLTAGSLLPVMIDVLGIKCKKSMQIALRCLKNLLGETSSTEISNRVVLFVHQQASIVVRAMDIYVGMELPVINLFLAAYSKIHNHTLNEDVMEKIVYKLFGTDDAVINASIDLLLLNYTRMPLINEQGVQLLLDTLRVFEKHEIPRASLAAVVEKFWMKGFFARFDGLFHALVTALECADNSSFYTKCIVYAITHCHELLIGDIKAKISPTPNVSDGTCWNGMRECIQSFVAGYPRCLRHISSHPEHFALMLNALQPEHYEFYRMCDVDCEKYCEKILYRTLHPVASKENTYPVLCRTLSAIFRYDIIENISEDIWFKLSEDYYAFFFYTRGRLKRHNLGTDQKLMDRYVMAITRLCVMMEIKNTSKDVVMLAEYLANDLRLVDRMMLTVEANWIFFRLYKNMLHALMQWYLEDPINRRATIKRGATGRRIHSFMVELTKRITNMDCEDFTCAVHMVVTFCDMLVLLHPTSQLHELAELQYNECEVEEELMEKLTQSIEKHVFHDIPDEHITVLAERKILLTKYCSLCHAHCELTRSSVHHVLLHYGQDTEFEEELETLLMNIYSSAGKDGYNKIISQTFHKSFLEKTTVATGKNFLKKIHNFFPKYELTADKDTYSFKILRCIIEMLLEYINDVGYEGQKGIFSDMLGTIKKWTALLPIGLRKELHRVISEYPHYPRENKYFHASLKRFLKSIVN
ncbi:uncharacterized protein LOC131207774 [Anopheles bellator]|uniref:uncharacterized protein LOC131207774 n=1 Tax=Anopheles bellator TaxID=139047 RepID=UPI0026491F0F|nr:uncharacterized protein LOC131207774 [Anopheles bellator]